MISAWRSEETSFGAERLASSEKTAYAKASQMGRAMVARAATVPDVWGVSVTPLR